MKLNPTLTVQKLGLDVTEVTASSSIISALTSPCNALVHAAGITLDAGMRRMPLNTFQKVMDVDYHAIVNIDDGMLKEKAFAPYSSVTMLSSVSGVAGNYGQVNYSTAKSGLLGYADYRSETVSPSLFGKGGGHGTSINLGTRNLSILDCFMDRNLEPESRNRVENGTRNLVSWKYMI